MIATEAKRTASRQAPWVCDGPTYEAVCTLLGWDASTNAVEVRELGADRVEVRGTALHPSEWRELARFVHCPLPDGRTIHLTEGSLKSARHGW